MLKHELSVKAAARELGAVAGHLECGWSDYMALVSFFVRSVSKAWLICHLLPCLLQQLQAVPAFLAVTFRPVADISDGHQVSIQPSL